MSNTLDLSNSTDVMLGDKKIVSLYGGPNHLWTKYRESRRNYVLNPSFETNTVGWLSVSSVNISRDTTTYYSGIASLKIQTPGVVVGEGCVHQIPPINTNIQLGAGVWLKAPINTPMFVSLRSGSTVNDARLNFTASGNWQFITVLHGAFPDMTTTISLYIRTNSINSTIFYVDSAIIELVNVIDYFDGNRPSTYAKRYRWLVAQNNSISIEEVLADA